jgi:hypothetical protein
MVPECKEGIREGKGGRETSVVQPSSASRAGCEVSRFRDFEVSRSTCLDPVPGSAGWTVIGEREITEVQTLSVEDCWRHQKGMRKNIMNPESCWVVPSRS